MRYRYQLYLMLAPFVVGLVLLVLFPAVASLAVAFFDYSPLKPTDLPWVGLGQFALLREDRLFWTALGNSLIYTVVSVPLRMVGALGLALFLEKRRKGIGLYRSAAYIPTIIPDVAYALMWLWIFNPLFGPITQVLKTLGLPGQTWLLDPVGAKGAIISMGVWQIGEGIVILLAALRDISPDLHDAALVDGAGWWTRLRLLVMPLIAPTFLLLLFRTTIVSLQDNFTPALLVTAGGPYYATYFLPLKIYQNAFQDFHFSYGAAMIWALYAISVVVVFLQFVTTRRWSTAAYD
ncbi:MAG TPA: sugar ABC transporter permease [Chloroflexia bacterium]|nr:sugar ABC transporter permease [Chloroflexia bacterium]